eukprot:15339404-Ditylum_brightwellii.AAC.1
MAVPFNLQFKGKPSNQDQLAANLFRDNWANLGLILSLICEERDDKSWELDCSGVPTFKSMYNNKN